MSHPASRFAKALPAILVGVFLVVLSVGAFENLNTVGDGTGGGGGSLSVETQTLQNVTSLGASTTFGITADYFVSTGLATSTLAGGLRITTGGLRVTTMASCDTIDTDSDGDLICGTDNTGAGGVTFPLSQSVTFSANNSWDLATATSSARNVYASGTVFASTLNAGIINSSNNTLLQINLNGAPSYGFSDTYFRSWNNNTVDLGTFDAAWADFFASGTSYLTTTNNAGTLTTGQLSVTGAATSTFTPGVSALGLSAGYLTLTGAGSSTIAGNLVVTGGVAAANLTLTGANTSTLKLITTTGLASTGGITVTGGSILNTSSATSTWTGGLSVGAGGLLTSSGLTVTGGSVLNTSAATSSFTGGFSALGLSGGYLTLTGAGTSTFVGNLSLNNLATARLAVTGSSSSTIASGLIISNGGLRVAGLLSCDTVDTDSTGKLICGTDGGGSGASFGGDAAFNVYPTTNNARDLGFSTSSWKDIYASGTVYLGGTAPITLSNPVGAQILLSGNAGINALTIDSNGALSGGNLLNLEVNNAQIAALTAAGRFNVNNQDGGIGFQISGTSPQWMLLESDGPTNEKYWSSYAEGGVLYFRTLSDGLSATTDYLRITRDDISISRLEYPVGGNVSYGTIGANGKLAVAAAGTATTTLFLQTPTATPSRTPAIEFSSTGSLRATPGVDTVGHSAFVLDTTASLVSAKLLSVRNNGSELAYFDRLGGLLAASSTVAAFRMTTSPSAGYVLTSDALGNASWAAAAGGSSFGGHSAFNIFPTTNNTYDLGFATSSWRNLYASSSLFLGGNLSIGGDVLPLKTNISSLGSPTGSFKDVYASGTYYLRGRPLSVSSTIPLVFPDTSATGTNSSVIIARVPNDCTIGAVTFFATGKPGTAYGTIVDVNTSSATYTNTTTIFTSQGRRPDLYSNQVSTTTVPAVTALTAGTIISADLDRYDGHSGMQIQIACATPIL